MERTPKSPVTLPQLHREELYGVLLHANGESAALPDTKILQALYAAEDFYEKDLHLLWQPTRVFSDVYGRQNGTFPPSIAELPADYDELKDIDEPAYDYPADFFVRHRWGHLDINYLPIRRVTQFFFAFPGTRPLFKIPAEWVRPDRKFGFVQLVPSGPQAAVAHFSAFVAGVLAGTMDIPQSIFIDYEAGFTHAQLTQRHQDLLEGLRLRVVLNLMGLVSTIVSGGRTSSSLGLDGLNRSQSWGGKYGPYSGRIELAMKREEEIRESWKQHERGVPIEFL